MEDRKYIISYQPSPAVGTLPGVSFYEDVIVFSLTICMLLGSLFGKRRVFRMNPQLREYQGFKEREDLVFLN